MQGGQPLLRIIRPIHHRVASQDLLVWLRGLLRQLINVFRLIRFPGAASRQSVLVARRSLADTLDLSFVVLSQQVKRLVRAAVERILLYKRLQARDGCRIRLAQVVEPSNFKFAIAQNFLHFQQPLLGLRHQLTVGELENHFAILILGACRMGIVAIGFLHLLEVDVRNLQLRFCCLRHVRKESLKIAVFLFRLRHSSRPAFRIPGICQRQFGAGHEL